MSLKIKRDSAGVLQQTDGKDSHYANLLLRRYFQLLYPIEWEQQNGEIRNNVDSGCCYECGFEVDTSSCCDENVPDLCPRYALKDCCTKIREIEPEIGPDQDMDSNVRLPSSSNVKKPPKLQKYR